MLQDSLGTSPYADIVGQIDPADGTARIDKKFGWPSNVLTSHAGLGMQHAILSDGLRIGIGHKRKRVAPGLAELLRLAGRIHADGYHFNAALMKLIQVLLETPQLGVAEWSPVPAIEDEDDSAMILQKLGG